MTDIDHLQGPTGRRFLHIHTDLTTYIVEIEDEDLNELRKRLEEPPTPFNGENNGDNDQ